MPCWLCGKPLTVRSTKSEQPYLSCMDCGMQMFIRSTAGARRLAELQAGLQAETEPQEEGKETR